MRAKWLRSAWYLSASLLVFAAVFSGCASTGSSAGYGPPPIEEGKGRLMLETGGINGVNFYVIDNETGDEVYSDSPRAAASSPIGGMNLATVPFHNMLTYLPALTWS